MEAIRTLEGLVDHVRTLKGAKRLAVAFGQDPNTIGAVSRAVNELVGARLLGGWAMGMAVLLVMVAVGTLIFKAYWGNFGVFLLLGAAASFWTAAFFGLFSALVRNRNQAGALGAPIILAFSLFGGSMMNPEAMPKAFKAVGVATPNRWFIDGARIVREGGFPLVSILVLVASGLVLAALASAALRRKTAV